MLSVPLRYNLHYGRVVKLAATADSKSAEGNLMSVRLRPRPPSTASPQDQCKDSPGWIDPAEAGPCRNGQKFTQFLTRFLACYDYLDDIKEVTGRRSGLKIRRPSGHGGSTPLPAPRLKHFISYTFTVQSSSLARHPDVRFLGSGAERGA